MYDKSRMSLMTFPMLVDIALGSISIEDSMLVAKENGVPYIDVMRVGKKDIAKYRAAMKETGVRVYTYIASISFISSLASRNGSIRKNLETASALGAKYMMIVPYSATTRKKAQRLGPDRVKELMIEGFSEATRIGKEYDIRICVETTPHDISRLSGTQDCLDILNAVPELDFVFDTANMLPHGDEPLDAYEKLKGRIAHVHLKDVALIEQKRVSSFAERSADGRVMKCVVWGRGVIPVQELYERMLADGYSGCFAIEYAHPDAMRCRVDEHIKQLGRFFEE